MAKNFEIVSVDNGVEITIDISKLIKADEIYFNATELAKMFGKYPKDYLKTAPTKEYIEFLCLRWDLSPNEIVKVKRGGKYQGTWMHHKLALDFARWLSPKFAVALDAFTEEKLKEAATWRSKRREAKTGFLPMTDAVEKAHDPVKFYHFSNEADLINRVVFGMASKKYKEVHGCEPRDGASADQLDMIKLLQISNTGLIEAGFSYQERKEMLKKIFENNQVENLIAAEKESNIRKLTVVNE